ncbi:ABC transporter permease [Microbacterium tumbae]
MRARWFAICLSLVFAVIFIAPTAVVVGSSFSTGSFIVFPPKGFTLRWYDNVLSDPSWLRVFGNSAIVGVFAAIVAVVVGLLLAVAAARSRLVPSGVVTAMAMMPIIVPTVVAGLGYYILAVRMGLTGTAVGLIVAHAAIGVPYVFTGVLASLVGADKSVEEAARISGANEASAFVRVVLPRLIPAVASGGLLAFLSSWDEVVIAGFLTTPTFKTLPVQLFADVSGGATPEASAVATLVTLVSFGLLAIVGLGLGATRLRKKRKVRT